MTKRIALDRLREISRHRGLRSPVLREEAGALAANNEMPAEWPVDHSKLR